MESIKSTQKYRIVTSTSEKIKSVDFDSSKSGSLILWVVAILIILLGIALSLVPFLDRNWLARAGALIVMLGVWSGIKGIFQFSILHEKLRAAKNNAVIRTRNKYRNDTLEEERLLDDINQLYVHDVEQLRSKLTIAVGMQEAIFILLGTFLWGFGDLFKYLF